MNRLNLHHFCLILALLGAAEAALPAAEQAALLDLSSSLSLSRFGWSPTSAPNACNIPWSGLECDASKTAVIRIILFAQSLVGTIPASIGNLTSLRALSLQQNFGIFGSIPDTIGMLTELRSINLGFTSISGTIPRSIGQCSKLESFQVIGTRLSGTIPPEIGGTNLSVIYLANNDLNGTLPKEISNLTNLVLFNLVSNRLTGSIPDSFGNLTNLISLSLGDNLFDPAPIPSWLTNLKKLQFLEFYIMRFIGQIPDIWSQLPSLRFLRLDNNQLSGTIPESLANAAPITHLELSSNSITGSLDFLCTLPALVSVNLMSNNFSGTIPECIGTRINMSSIQLSSNRLEGTIPPGIGNLINLVTFDVSINSLSGPLPSRLSNFTALSSYFVLQNGLQGCFTPPRAAVTGNRCDASLNVDLCACSPENALCNVRLCSCKLPKPLEDVYCSSQTRLWTSFTSIIVKSSSTISIGNQVVINGNLTVSPSSTLQLAPPMGVLQAGTTLVNISGCATFSGRLQISLPSNFTPQVNTEIKLVDFTGFCNSVSTQFAEVAVTIGDGCRQDGTSLRYSEVSLTLVFVSMDDSRCYGAAAFPSANLGAIVGGAIAGFVVLLVIIGVIIVMKVTSLRNKVLPFKEIRDTAQRAQVLEQELVE